MASVLRRSEVALIVFLGIYRSMAIHGLFSRHLTSVFPETQDGRHHPVPQN